MGPHWLMIVSWIALGLGLASALAILVDEFVLGRRQHMAVMNLVHPITALYWGPVWLSAYFRHGRKSSHAFLHQEAARLKDRPGEVEELKRKGQSTDAEDVRPWYVGNAVSHCGAGCTLGDIGGEWILFAVFASPTLGITGTYGWEIIADFILAWTLGIAFQYFTIVPMRDDVGKLQGVWQAMKVDTLSILAFQVGLFGWMAISHFVLFSPPLKVDTASHWFMMQVGMILGYLTAWPVNRWLVRRGIKEKMDYRKHLAMVAEQMRDDDHETQTRRDRLRARAQSVITRQREEGVMDVVGMARSRSCRHVLRHERMGVVRDDLRGALLDRPDRYSGVRRCPSGISPRARQVAAETGLARCPIAWPAKS